MVNQKWTKLSNLNSMNRCPQWQTVAGTIAMMVTTTSTLPQSDISIDNPPYRRPFSLSAIYKFQTECKQSKSFPCFVPFWAILSLCYPVLVYFRINNQRFQNTSEQMQSVTTARTRYRPFWDDKTLITPNTQICEMVIKYPAIWPPYLLTNEFRKMRKYPNVWNSKSQQSGRNAIHRGIYLNFVGV